MTELELRQPQGSLTEAMDYARAVSTAAMLPDNYRGKPADIMLAVGLGQSMGLSPAESLYRIAVIKGKPTASAELIAANVRKAGHRLRVTGDSTTATATIIRADDPDFAFTVTRDLEWARGMGLDSQPNYKKQPGTMLQWRAISAVARLACPEALYGVAYTSDELADVGEQRRSSSSLAEQIGAAPTLSPAPDAPGPLASVEPDIASEPEQASAGESAYLNPSSALARRMFALMGEVAITERDDRLRYVSDTLGRTVGSSKEMTEDDARAVIARLEQDAEPVQAELIDEATA